MHDPGDPQFLCQAEKVFCTFHIDVKHVFDRVAYNPEFIPTRVVDGDIHARHPRPHGFFIGDITFDYRRAHLSERVCLRAVWISHKCPHLPSALEQLTRQWLADKPCATCEKHLHCSPPSLSIMKICNARLITHYIFKSNRASNFSNICLAVLR